jgi:hypothetical protein
LQLAFLKQITRIFSLSKIKKKKKMSKQFFPRLSQNYIEILENNEYYDITIEVGKEQNVEIFRAHMIILCYRSPFLRQILFSNKKNNDNDVLTNIKLPNITPEIFQIILR